MPFYGQYENACPFSPCFPFSVTGLENVFLKHFYSLSFLLFTPWFHGANYGQPDRNFVVDFPNEKNIRLFAKLLLCLNLTN